MVIREVDRKLAWLSVVSLILSVVSLTMYTWGRYIYLLCAVLVAGLYAVRDHWHISRKLDTFQKMFAAFCIYAGLSAVWAFSASDSITKMVTLLSILICYYPIYIYYRDYSCLDELVSAVKWGNIAACIYTITFFGLDALIRSAQADNLRIYSEFANTNTVGLCAALAIFLQLWQLLFGRGAKWEAVTFIPAVLVLGAAQSKKAIIFVFIGLLCLLLIRYGDPRKPLNMIFAVIGVAAVMALALYAVSQMEIFEGLLARFQTMLNTVEGTGRRNGSTWMRMKMMELGIEWWKKSPLIGVGINNPHILARTYLNFDAYLHNNYAELLCGGGLIGFALYYGMHARVLLRLVQLRNANKPFFALLITWCLLMLVTDFGMVSYYSKLDLFYLMVVFLGVEEMKRTPEPERKLEEA